MKLNPALKPFWKKKAQIKVLYGGRMSSKTMDTAGIILYLASKYRIRVACLRRFQNKLSESVFSTLKRIANDDDRLRHKFITTENTIKGVNGSEFVFMGIQRNLEEIKGLDDIDITWIEEAEKLTEEQWNLIRPTILRKEDSFVILVFNPHLDTDYVYKEFVLGGGDNVLKRLINYNENPFLSKSARYLIESDKKKMDEDDFNNIYLGLPKQDDDESVIKRKWLYECIDAHKKLGIEINGQSAIGYDVADSGDDKNCYVVRTGILTVELKEWKAKEDELLKSSKIVWEAARKYNALVSYDCVGVGAGVGSNMQSLNELMSGHIKYVKFNAGAAVESPTKNYRKNIKNKDMFANLKAQAWWNIADRIKLTYNAIVNKAEYNQADIISISSDIDGLEELIIELSTPKKDFDNANRVKVESKKDLSKRGIKSPNKADAFIMAYYIKKSNSFF